MKQNVNRHLLLTLIAAALCLAKQSFSEVQTTLNMTMPSLTIGTSGTFTSSQASGPVGSNSGTVLHSYAGIEQFIQTSGSGRFAPLDGIIRYGVGFDTLQFFQSFISANYLTVLNSNTVCPGNSSLNWILVRLRTPDASSGSMNVASPNLSVGGVFNYDATTSTFTGTKYFNLSGPSLISSPTYGITGFSGAVCNSGTNKARSTGISNFDPYLYAYYGTRFTALVSAHGNPQIAIAAPVESLTGHMSDLSTYVFTGLYTYYSNKNTTVSQNIYLYPDASGTTYTMRKASSLTDPFQYTSFGTLILSSIDFPSDGFLSGTVTLDGVDGVGKIVCMVSKDSSENLFACTGQYPGKVTNAITILAKTVKQAVVQVTVSPSAASVAEIGNSTTMTATVVNLSSRYVSSIGNPGGGLDLTSPWSNTGAYSGTGTCGTSLNAYSSCTFPIQFISSALGTDASGTLRVKYDNGITTPNATASLIGVTGLVSITVTPNTSQNNQTTTQMTATAKYTDNSTQDVTNVVLWTSSNTAIGTLSKTTQGLASWLAPGSTTVSAQLGAVSGNSSISVVDPVILTAVTDQNFPSQYLNQSSTFNADFNNISGGAPGDDNLMSYTCVYDKVVDSIVSPGTSCASLPGTASFNTSTGVFSWTPNAKAWGAYEIKVTGTKSSGGTGNRIFIVDVRQPYYLTNLRASYDANFANLTSPYLSGNFFFEDLSTNGYDGTLSSTVHGTWVGNGSYNSPYALSLDGLATVDFGSSVLSNSYNRLMFSTWINPSTINAPDIVILGNSKDGSGNGFTLRQSSTASKKLDFSIGFENTYTAFIGSNNPIAYYRLNESGGSAFSDSGSGGYHLTLGGSGTAFSVSGAINGDSDPAVSFNGSGYACRAMSGTASGTFSVEAWVNPATSAGSLGIIGSRKPSDYSFAMKYEGGKFHGEIGDGTSWIASAADTAAKYTTLNAWYHVVYVVTPTGYTVYVDGVSAGSGSYSSSTPLLFNSTHDLCLGASGNNFEKFNGKIDEAAVYDFALTSAQVLSHYDLGRSYFTTVVGDLPVGYWRLGELSGTTIHDVTASGWDLTASASGITYNRSGALSRDSNGSLNFDGTGSVCKNLGASSLTGTFSVEAWAYPTSATQLSGIMGSRYTGNNSFDMKYQSGKFHGDIGNGSSWLSTTADTAVSFSTLNTWYHVVYVVTASGYTIYVNGSNAGSGSYSSSTPVLFDSTHTLCIGASASNNFERFFGNLDEVAVYNYALSASQVSNHYNTGVGSNAVTACISNTALSNNTWYHVAGIYDGSTAKLYINGHPECSLSVSGSVSSPASNLVAGGTSLSTRLWAGLMNSLQIYATNDASPAASALDVYSNFAASADEFRAFPIGDIETDSLVLHYDAANATRGLSFPGVGIDQTSWFDISSSILDATLSGFTGASGSQWAGSGTAASPYALVFNGTNNKVVTGYTQTSVTAYSVEVWVNTTDAGAKRTFVQNRDSGAGKSLTLGIGASGGGHGGAGKVGWELDSDSIDIGVSSTATINDGVWHHVVGTWSASSGSSIATSQFKIYIDGNLAATTSATTGSATSPLTGLSTTVIGYHAPWVTYTNMQLAKVAIYTKALSAAQVKQNCKAIVSRFSGASCP